MLTQYRETLIGGFNAALELWLYTPQSSFQFALTGIVGYTALIVGLLKFHPLLKAPSPSALMALFVASVGTFALLAGHGLYLVYVSPNIASPMWETWAGLGMALAGVLALLVPFSRWCIGASYLSSSLAWILSIASASSAMLLAAMVFEGWQVGDAMVRWLQSCWNSLSP